MQLLANHGYALSTFIFIGPADTKPIYFEFIFRLSTRKIKSIYIFTIKRKQYDIQLPSGTTIQDFSCYMKCHQVRPGIPK